MYSKHRDRSKPKYMTFTEFKTFISDLDLYNETLLTDRDVNLAYNLSIQPQADEITKNRHMEM